MRDLILNEPQSKKQKSYKKDNNNITSYTHNHIKKSFSKHKPKIFYKDRFLSSVNDYLIDSKYESTDKYNKKNENLMLRYTYSNNSKFPVDYETDMTRTKAKFFHKTKGDIENILNKSRANFKTNETKEKENNAQIFIFDKDFKDPIDSLGLILKNKTIHDKVLYNYNDRTIQNFGNTINKFCRLKEMMNISKLVKVTSIMPQTFEKEFLQQENINITQPIIFSNEKKEEIIIKEKINNKQQRSLSHKFNLLPSDFIKGWVYLLTGFQKFSKTCPESREQFSFNYDSINNCIFLFSGNCSYIGTQQLWKYNLLNYQWEPIKPITINNIDARSGHTAIIYKNKLIIFGGRYLHNTMYADLDYYNIDNNTWTNGQLNTNLFLKLRRNHIACLVGSQMFIHGGVDDTGEYLDDAYLLSLNTQFNWTKASIFSYVTPPKLGYHSCCLVVPNEYIKSTKFSIYKFPEIYLSESINTQIKEMGIYVFGGKRSELKDPSNKLWILKIGRKPLEWIEIKTKGKPPCPRYLCSMNFYEQGNYIIIHGGKTKSLMNENILKDTYLLELYRFEWIKVNYGYLDHTVKPRYSHSGIIYQQKLIIFGGVNEKGYNGSDFFLIKLQPDDLDERASPKSKKTKNQLTLVIENKFKPNGKDEKVFSADKVTKKNILNNNKMENDDNDVKKNIFKKKKRNKSLPGILAKKIIK